MGNPTKRRWLMRGGASSMALRRKSATLFLVMLWCSALLCNSFTSRPLYQTTIPSTSPDAAKFQMLPKNNKNYEAMKASSVAAVGDEKENLLLPFPVQLNEFFKKPVPKVLRQSISIFYEETPEKDPDVVTMLTAAPTVPGHPRPLWVVLLGSLPTGLLWYGYYKFAVEEELLQIEIGKGKEPQGFGGYGSLGIFSYLFFLGPMAELTNTPGGFYWSSISFVYLYYTQFLLYDRVNDLYREEGRSPPLQAWWSLPFLFPFNLIVGLRQVHFLSQYLYEQRGVLLPPTDPIAEVFPFIKVEKLTWQELLLSPSLWCSAFAGIKSIERNKLPSIVKYFLSK